MNHFSKICVLLVLCLACYAQTAQAPTTANEVQYLGFMLMNLASLDHSPDATGMFEASLAQQFGLNSQESATIHAAGQALKPLLAQLRASSQTIVIGKTTLTASDSAALAALAAQRESQIATLSNQILNSVRPETAERLRMPGSLVANALNATKGGN